MASVDGFVTTCDIATLAVEPFYRVTGWASFMKKHADCAGKDLSRVKSELNRTRDASKDQSSRTPPRKLGTMHLTCRIECIWLREGQEWDEIYPPLGRWPNTANHSKRVPDGFAKANDGGHQSGQQDDRWNKVHMDAQSVSAPADRKAWFSLRLINARRAACRTPSSRRNRVICATNWFSMSLMS
ncbi:hypothetical protein [Hydrogenophaga flava]|uniref:hypothetical protein n=1 Tax=Hydrogenophaga flava TaxID=65657 RepID=UPI0012F924E6|nr:hypothetical protein [Hydrogenophaga flava]